MAFRIFVVEDEADYATLIGYRLRKSPKVEARFFPTGEAALAALNDAPDAIFLDVMMPGIGGLETLRTIREYRPRIPVVMLTSQTSKELVLRAMEYGAYDYVVKGQDDMKRIPVLLEHLQERKALLKGAEAFVTPRPHFWGFPNILGESEAMENTFVQMRGSLRGRHNIALLGEVGVGKTILAQMLYRCLADRTAPIYGVNCRHQSAAAKLFGTSATSQQAAVPGLIHQAQGGLLILENVDALSLAAQKHLLQLLEGTGKRPAPDIQFLTTSAQNIAQIVQQGQFAHRLYNHLFAYSIGIPPLRKREHDVLLLAMHFRKAFLTAYPKAPHRRFTPEARQVITRYQWPGNVAELKAVIERALSNLQSTTEGITPKDLFPKLGARPKPAQAQASSQAPASPQPTMKR